MFNARVAGLFLVILLAGCSSSGPKEDAAPDGDFSSSSSAPAPVAKAAESCRANRSGCLYNGPYESGERDYAQKAAANLNKAELLRLKRSFGQ
ncbi:MULTISPECIES: hypothetical protein [unclassified Achromobacter]|uniref:hypothetical protein n=1 Tax=unclassified Achromobacter TaxID=2626865 RepID=UPI000B517FF3|nr:MULTISPECIES: hypothetical protein [unclassified Achromobacter]OWT74712.1 hypothetical protein CEY05_19225 [Achromobacter sp. HZ34]OWT79179.1 hypothetical protein CEY04_09145 [Achromobacter sp. HZ28]